MSNEGKEHLYALRQALDHFESQIERLDHWGEVLAERLSGNARILTVGNGGSAAHAEHLSSEFVGRYASDRRPFSALALHVDGAALTALTNDYGAEQMFARQVQAHMRPGDVMVAFSTSGRSPNVIQAARAARELGATVWSLTGPLPNPLADVTTEVLAVSAGCTATVQEIHQVAIHLLCAAFDRHLREQEDRPSPQMSDIAVP